MTQCCHKDTTLNQQCCDREHTTVEGKKGGEERRGEATQEGARQYKRGQEQCEGEDPIRTRGSTHTTPRHSIGPQGKRQGGTPTRRRGHQHSTGSQQHCRPSLTMPPTTTTAPHHPRRPHPPPREGEADRGYPTTRTAQTRRRLPAHHTPGNEQRTHDSSTRQHCNGMSRARAAPPHRAGRQQYTPPPFHTPRRMDTIHSSTHLLSLIRVHTTDDH